MMRVRFGPAVCGADGPEDAGPGCTREDTAAAHADGLHSDRLGKYGGVEWPTTEDERARWAWLLRPKDGPHACKVPNAKAVAFSAGLRGEDPLDEVWVCPDCLQHWEIEVDSCYECGRSDDPEWVRSREWHGQDTSFADAMLGMMSRTFDADSLAAGMGYKVTAVTEDESGIVAAGGWCAPSDTVYALAGRYSCEWPGGDCPLPASKPKVGGLILCDEHRPEDEEE